MICLHFIVQIAFLTNIIANMNNLIVIIVS